MFRCIHPLILSLCSTLLSPPSDQGSFSFNQRDSRHLRHRKHFSFSSSPISLPSHPVYTYLSRQNTALPPFAPLLDLFLPRNHSKLCTGKARESVHLYERHFIVPPSRSITASPFPSPLSPMASLTILIAHSRTHSSSPLLRYSTHTKQRSFPSLLSLSRLCSRQVHSLPPYKHYREGEGRGGGLNKRRVVHLHTS